MIVIMCSIFLAKEQNYNYRGVAIEYYISTIYKCRAGGDPSHIHRFPAESSFPTLPYRVGGRGINSSRIQGSTSAIRGSKPPTTTTTRTTTLR